MPDSLTPGSDQPKPAAEPKGRPTCFIIMPISTPERVREQYGSGDHFGMVLEHIHKPAVEAAKFEAISPVAEGSELIAGHIIKNLNDADLVLCDISIENPNVLFELGVRVAMDKPVAIVMDEKLGEPSFDLKPLNVTSYQSGLMVDVALESRRKVQSLLERQSAKLQEGNPLWRASSFAAATLSESSAQDTDSMVFRKLLDIEAKVNGVTSSLPDRPTIQAPTGRALNYGIQVRSMFARESLLKEIPVAELRAESIVRDVLPNETSRRGPCGLDLLFRMDPSVDDSEFTRFEMRVQKEIQEAARFTELHYPGIMVSFRPRLPLVTNEQLLYEIDIQPTLDEGGSE